MSTPPIYPKGYDPDYVMDVSHPDGPRHMVPWMDHWPIMLGLLTIIGDAVRGVPWGKPAEVSPVLPEVGSVWVGHGAHNGTPYVCRSQGGALTPIVMRSTVPGREVSDDLHFYDVEALHRVLTPATVIPTPTADGWRRLADEQPKEGEMCWWIADDDDPADMVAERYDEQSADWWLWQPVPPGVIPPPPADRDKEQ